MSTWIKWWKDKAFMTILGIATSTILIGFILSYFITWGWIPTIILAIINGRIIKKIADNKINKIL